MTKKRAGYFLLTIVMCTIFYLAHRADQAGRRVASSVPVLALVGTWKADNGSLFQFRDDGTGRSRDPTSPKPTVHYFEWTADESNFTIVYAPRGKLKGLIAKSLGVETAHFILNEIPPDSFTLADGTPASKTLFERTQDAMLDDAL